MAGKGFTNAFFEAWKPQGPMDSMLQTMQIGQALARNELTRMKMSEHLAGKENRELRRELETKKLETEIDLYSDPKYAQGQLLKSFIDVGIKKGQLVERGQKQLKEGNVVGANKTWEPLGLSAVKREGIGTSYNILDSSTNKVEKYDPFFRERNNPKAVMHRQAEAKRRAAGLEGDVKYIEKVDKAGIRLADDIKNVSSRRHGGMLAKVIMRADSGLTLLGGKLGLGKIPENITTLQYKSKHGTELEKKESKAELDKLAASWDELTGRMAHEASAVLESILTQGVPSIYGMQKLDPETGAKLLAHYNEFIANDPTGAQMGHFLIDFAGAFQRERNLYRGKQIEWMNGVAIGQHAWMMDPNHPMSTDLSRRTFTTVMTQLAKDININDPSTFPTEKDFLHKQPLPDLIGGKKPEQVLYNNGNLKYDDSGYKTSSEIDAGMDDF